MSADSQPATVRLLGYPATVALYPAASAQAPAIIALHGFTGSGQDFLPLREALGPGRVHWILPDWMGHGASASPPVVDPYSLPAALRLIDAARQMAPDPRRVLLLGYSMGGRIALHYLLRAAPLPALLIGASPGLAEPAERVARRAADQEWVRLLAGCSASGPDMEPFCRAWETQSLIEPQTRLSQPLRSALAARRRLNNPVGLAHSLLACGAGALPPLWDALPGLPPVRFAHGESDGKFAALGRAAARRNPSFLVEAVPGAGHAAHLEAPVAVAALLAGMLL